MHHLLFRSVAFASAILKKRLKAYEEGQTALTHFLFQKRFQQQFWMYGKVGDWIRYDFEKDRNGKCITIYI